MTHELEGRGSLRQCIHCGRYFHNEGDPDAESQECDGVLGNTDEEASHD